MTTVEEIEQAAEKLSPAEFARLASWVGDRNHRMWTQQMDRDAASGKLDFLFDEAESERSAGALHDWPPKNK